MTVARFSAGIVDGTWSVVLTFDLADPSKHRATVRFLMAEAPHATLVPGLRFELVEGGRTVADVALLRCNADDKIAATGVH